MIKNNFPFGRIEYRNQQKDILANTITVIESSAGKLISPRVSFSSPTAYRSSRFIIIVYHFRSRIDRALSVPLFLLGVVIFTFRRMQIGRARAHLTKTLFDCCSRGRERLASRRTAAKL